VPAGPRRATVIGGGLAGISAAVGLVDRGWRVTLVESRPRLGGAAYSFERDGMVTDTGVHVVLRCYQDYFGLLTRMGAADLVPVQQRMSIPVLRPGAAPSMLRRGRWGPPPAHLLPALLGYRELSMRERAAAARVALAARRLDPDDPALDAMSLARWLHRHGQDRHAIEALWGLLCVAALNIDPMHAPTGLMARVWRTGLLDRVDSGDIGVPAAPLSQVHDGPARALLGRLGVECRIGCRATAIERLPAGFTVRTRDGSLDSEAVVCAVPHRQAATLVPSAAAPGRGDWEQLGASPIVNVHLRLDRIVTGGALVPGGFAAVLGSSLQWIFDRTGAAGQSGQYLVSSVSAADAAIKRPAAELLARARDEIGALFPEASTARLVDGFVTREPHATFRQATGSARYRPTAATAWPGLVLAGSWTATGLPDTLEGAVRSGRIAAESLGGQARPGEKSPAAPDGGLAGWREHDRQPEVMAP
jgi:squalene-associated FAD-dependent desaturase